ncbi:MAG TPA: UDP-glucose 4-epimerase GalE [Candidatus Saccharimonadia bacterium]
MKVFIAGGAGYIGGTTAHLMRDKGHEVIIFDNFSTGHKHNVDDFECIAGDITNRSALESALQGKNFDLVLDFAAKLRIAESVAHPHDYFTTNTMGTLNVVESALKSGVNHIIFSSTAAVYGEPEKVPIDEMAAIRPVNPYGMSKFLAENILRSYQATHALNWVAFRYFNAAGAYKQIGDYPDTQHLIPCILDALHDKRELKVFGSDYDTPDGTCLRDYIHVVDVAEAHVLAAEAMVAGKKLNQAINLGTNHGSSVLEIIQAVEKAAETSVPYRLTARRPGDSGSLIASNLIANQVLGWQPQFGLERTVADAVSWHNDFFIKAS